VIIAHLTPVTSRNNTKLVPIPQIVMSKSGIKTVFGGASVGQSFKTIEDCHAVFKLLKAHHVDTIDTAQLYGSSEQILGEANAGEQFTIDTKTPGGFFPDTNSKDLIIKNGHESPKKLRASIDIFYIHAPSKNEPNADVLSAVNQLHQAGVFKRFGLSNFVASHVQAVYDYCDKNGFLSNPPYTKETIQPSPAARKLSFCLHCASWAFPFTLTAPLLVAS
jgi:aflatoxin B1 aldehyde reductase